MMAWDLRSARWSVAAIAVALTSSACFFMPKIEDTGYTECATDADCAPGRVCGFEICAPPDWNDPDYKQRQLLVVENPSGETLEKGAPVPVEIGPNGVVPLANFGGQGRFAFYDDGEWRLQPAYFDRFADRFVAYLPLPAALGPGERAALAWIETTYEGEAPEGPTLSPQDDTSVFSFFEGFGDEGVDGGPALDGGPAPSPDPAPEVRDFEGDDNFRIHGGGGVATIRDDTLTIRDNQQLSGRIELLPPVRATFVGRFNNTTCTSVFFGFRGQSGIGYAPPSAEFSVVGAQLEGVLEIAPGPLDTPTAISNPIPLDNVIRRYSIEITNDQVRADIDGAVFATAENLRPGYQPDVPLFLVLDVDGNNCSFDLEEIRVAKLGLPGPSVTAEEPVEFIAYGAP